jgi:hypothetical protein
MKIDLLYSTPHYHKLVESVARVCYQSYNKLSPTSHEMLKGIMGKGHLSVASVGNIVYGITFGDKKLKILETLMEFKEINNYIRWTLGGTYDVVVSLNALTLRELVYYLPSNYLVNLMVSALVKNNKYEVLWLIDDCIDSNEIKVDSPYISSPSLLKPSILSSDYTSLKDKLNRKELMYHSTVTIDIVTDRATGLQMWRHADMVGGCEMSQRYVDMTNNTIRIPTDLKETDKEFYNRCLNISLRKYKIIKSFFENRGKKRSQELARGVLPNYVLTRLIQCRPLKQWKHFFDLRITPHAQLEIQQDAESILNAFKDSGVDCL